MPFLGLPFESTDAGHANSIANGNIARMRHPRFAAIEGTHASSFCAALPDLQAIDSGVI
jgi:hypothetical protein